MSNPAWTSVATYADRISAEAILGLLTSQSVPCYIASNEHVPGLGTKFSVCVPSRLTDAANTILADNRVSDSELTDLAMSVPRDESSAE